MHMSQPRDRRSINDLLDQIRSEWERVHAEKVELNAENHRLRWRLENRDHPASHLFGKLDARTRQESQGSKLSSKESFFLSASPQMSRQPSLTETAQTPSAVLVAPVGAPFGSSLENLKPSPLVRQVSAAEVEAGLQFDEDLTPAQQASKRHGTTMSEPPGMEAAEGPALPSLALVPQPVRPHPPAPDDVLSPAYSASPVPAWDSVQESSGSSPRIVTFKDLRPWDSEGSGSRSSAGAVGSETQGEGPDEFKDANGIGLGVAHGRGRLPSIMSESLGDTAGTACTGDNSSHNFLLPESPSKDVNGNHRSQGSKGSAMSLRVAIHHVNANGNTALELARRSDKRKASVSSISSIGTSIFSDSDAGEDGGGSNPLSPRLHPNSPAKGLIRSDTSRSLNKKAKGQGPQQFDMLPMWTKKRKAESRASYSSARRMRWASQHEGMRWGVDQTSKGRRFAMNPHSVLAMSWDFVVIILLSYDVIFVPMQAFDLDWAGLDHMDLTSMIGWTLDVAQCFFRGYHMNGVVEYRLNYIAYRYLTTWFPFDIIVVSLDWLFFIATVASGGMENVKWLSRAKRIIRFMRLLRLLRVWRTKYMGLINKIKSDVLSAITRIVMAICALGMINHFVCCGWYAIGVLPEGFPRRWTEENFMEDSSLEYRYTTSFHWSITQFTPASMEVVPTNALERLYCTTVILLGLAVFSAFVSNMTASLTHLTKQQYEKSHRWDMLQRYMYQNNVSIALGAEVLAAINVGATNRKNVVLEQDIAGLTDVPNPLRERLHHEVHGTVLRKHPLFNIIESKDMPVFISLCHNAVVERACAEGEEAFRYGTSCKAMHFVASGRFTYTGGLEEGTHYEDCFEGTWFCEGALWVKWDYRGSLTAVSHSSMKVLDVSECHIMFGRSVCFHELRLYARAWAQGSALDCEGADKVNDYWGQHNRVLDMTDNVFRELNAVEDGAAKMMAFWWPEQLTPAKIVDAWRNEVRKQKLLRMPGIKGAVVRCLRKVQLQVTRRQDE